MHAAKGPSIAAEATADPRPRRKVWPVFAALGLVLYAVDQATKQLALERLRGQPDVQVIGDLLQLRLAFNPGAAFSTGTEYTPVLSVVACVALVVVLWLSRRLGSLGWACALGFLLAGVAGNLTDRIFRDPAPFRGHVVDFLMLPNWPIFNVADICINVAAGLIIVLAFKGIHIDGTREERESDDEDVSADEPTEKDSVEDAADDEATS